MSDERMWVVTGTWTGPEKGLFSGTHTGSPTVIVADDADDAIRHAIRSSSVLGLDHGISFEVRPVGDTLDATYEAKYDAPPLTGGLAPNPNARLRIRKFTHHETELGPG